MSKKAELLETIAGKNRGLLASEIDNVKVLSAIQQLEDTNPTKKPLEAKDLLNGDWRLLYTTSKGILGIVENTSNNFATVQSILNEKSNINAKIKNTDHFGSLVWDTKRYNVVQLVDIPRLVPLTIGDTIVTGGMSSIFPENIPIGTIRKFDLNTSKSFYNIDVALFNDMTNIKNVYIIDNSYREEILELEKQTETNGQ